MSKKAVHAAVNLYRSFRESEPSRLGVVNIDLPKAVAVIGHVESICYRTTHGGKMELYEHPFQAGSRPLLAASSDGRQLLLLGGRFKFGARGIVDIDQRGKPVYEPRHGKDIGSPGYLRRRQANPGRKTRKGNPRQKDVFAAIRALGLTVKKTGYGDEIRVAYKLKDKERAEASAHYTDDLEDALATARAMATSTYRPD